jgi:hypothetical protein
MRLADSFGDLIKDDDGPIIIPGIEKWSSVSQLTSASSPDTSTWHPINIVFDVTNVDRQVNSEIVNALEQLIFKEVKRRLEPMIQVFGSGKLTLPSQLTCFESLQIPSNFIANGEGDLLVEILVRNEPTKAYLAAAGPCYFDESTGRPIVGVLIINKHYFDSSLDGVIFWIDNVLHEMFHILIFSESIWKTLPTGVNNFVESVTKQEAKLKLLKGKSIIEYGRKHFGCDSFAGILMEDGGATGNVNIHFEKLMFGNEIMTSKFTAISVLSRFTLLALADSGLYKIDFGQAEPFTWGYKKGCDFLSKSCILPFEEFCSVQDAVSCTHDFLSKSVCAQDQYTNGCFVNEFMPYNSCRDTYGFVKNFDFEFNGANSRCFVVKDSKNVKSAACLETYCSLDSTTIQIKVGDLSMVCSSKDDILTTNGVTIKCPDPIDFCYKSIVNKCSNDCSGKGKCLENGKCFCYFLYQGEACEIFRDCKGVDSCDLMKVNSKGVTMTTKILDIVTIMLMFTIM